MNINDLLSPLPTPIHSYKNDEKKPIHDEHLMSVWEQLLEQSGFKLKTTCERNTLTDAILTPLSSIHQQDHFIKETPIHIKVIGRHMNGSFRCHIGTGKASRPIQSKELSQQMRLLAVFFRVENSKSQLVAPDFIFFPTWLFHLFRYTQYDTTPGRTDVRFLEDASMAKEDHIYRLNHVLNSLFRFNLRNFNKDQLCNAVALTNYLFDHVGLDCFHRLPCPSPILIHPPLSTTSLHHQETTPFIIMPPSLYTSLINYLHAPRPLKKKPMCNNCNAKIASRRKLCVACYRYHLKHGEARPLRLIVANRPGPKHHHRQYHHHQQQQEDDDEEEKKVTCDDIKNDQIKKRTQDQSTLFLSSSSKTKMKKSYQKSSTSIIKNNLHKSCANCGVHETHQWYRNLCGQGHWCETCKSYYLRHNKVRPPELFMKAAKRKVNIRSLVSWATLDWDQQLNEQYQQLQQHYYPQMSNNNNNNNNNSSSNNSNNHNDHHSSMTTSSSSPSPSPTSSPSSISSYYNYYNAGSSNLQTSPSLTTNWVSSGCKPHLYHSRRNSNSGYNSPTSIASPTTPPPLSLPSLSHYDFNKLPLSPPPSSTSNATF
ncbi:unnamed protein product [Cunninghamella blakesleeana]